MADLGFLPQVRRLLDATPQSGQRMLFSATLDGGISVIAKRYLHNPVTHQADSAQSPISTMSHHVLHVTTDGHLPVLLDLVADASKVIVLGGCSCFDQQSWDLVVNLHKRAPTVMLVLFARPPEGRTNGESEHRALIADANVLVLKLLPWSREHICKLVCAVTHTVALDDAVGDQLW